MPSVGLSGCSPHQTFISVILIDKETGPEKAHVPLGPVVLSVLTM